MAKSHVPLYFKCRSNQAATRSITSRRWAGLEKEWPSCSLFPVGLANNLRTGVFLQTPLSNESSWQLAVSQVRPQAIRRLARTHSTALPRQAGLQNRVFDRPQQRLIWRLQ